MNPIFAAALDRSNDAVYRPMKLKQLISVRRRIAICCSYPIGLLFCLFFNAAFIYAHSPHDVIDAIALSPIYHKDKTVFIAMEETLRRTTDGGASWKDIVNGLNNKFPFTSIAISPNFQIGLGNFRTYLVLTNLHCKANIRRFCHIGLVQRKPYFI